MLTIEQRLDLPRCKQHQLRLLNSWVNRGMLSRYNVPYFRDYIERGGKPNYLLPATQLNAVLAAPYSAIMPVCKVLALELNK